MDEASPCLPSMGALEDAGGPRFVAPKGLACANKGTTNLGRFQRSEEEPLEIMVKLTCDVERKCLQLLFGQGKKKLGFIPTEVKPGEFILRGMWVNEELRGQGLASLFLALWLKLCLMLEVTPLTDRIHKPILSLVLQKFGFVAATSHLKVEVATCEGGADEPKMLLWSESKKLSSYFSVRAQRDQGIRLVDSRPEKSRTAFVNTTFSIPDIGAMASLIDQALAGGDLVLYESQRAVSLLEDLRSGGWPHWAPMPKAKGVLAPAVTTEPLRTKFDTMFSWLGLGNKPEGIPVEKGVHLAPDLEKGGSPTRSELPPLEAIDDRPEIEFQPLDILGFYKTADEWKASDGVAKRQLERKEPPDHVRLEDVAGQMNFLMMDKDNDESIALTVTKSLEALTKKTVTRDNKDSRQQLDAARICQIENRLKNDPSLQIEKKPNGDPAWNIPENPAELIKKKLIRTYTKIKKSGHDMSIVTVHQLEERVETLKRL